jgi:hypothetical protein
LSLLVTSLGLAGGILLGRAIARTLRRGAPPHDGSRGTGGGPKPPEAGGAPDGSGNDGTNEPLVGFPCHLGDVILASHGEEAWLAGALVFRERLPMAILFIAPDAGGDRAIFARPAPQASLLWLSPAPSSRLVIGKEPPSSLEYEQERFERTRRVPYRVDRIGTGAPDVGQEVILAEYKAATGDRLVVVIGSEGARAWRGRVLEDGTYDLLPGSPPTAA